MTLVKLTGKVNGKMVWLVGGIADVYEDQECAQAAVEKTILGEIEKVRSAAKVKAIELLLKGRYVEEALEIFNGAVEQCDRLAFSSTQVRVK